MNQDFRVSPSAEALERNLQYKMIKITTIYAYIQSKVPLIQGMIPHPQ